jgi:CheY-like chemotaxis protein
MVSSTNNLKTLLETLKSLGFFDRVFGWSRIEALNFVAYSEFQTMISECQMMISELTRIQAQNEQAQNFVRMISNELENQKNQYSQLKEDYDILRNSTGNIYDVLTNRERELSELKESESRNGERLVELEKESDRLCAIIDGYLRLNQEKENELRALKEADVKNTQKITELIWESDKLRTAFEQFSQKISQEEPVSITSDHEISRSPKNPHEKRILLVEDDPDVAGVIKAMLKHIGYTLVGIAASSEKAITMANESRPDIILLDIHLEGEADGIVTAKKIKELFGTPIIFLTAHSDDETIYRIVMTESEGYLVKPINPRELFANIEIALHKKQKINAAS